VPPVVTVTALDPNASEVGPDIGTFRFARTGDAAAPLSLTYTLSGTAINGVDYQIVPATTINFGAGEATTDLTITPIADGTAEGVETVTVTLTDAATYDLGASSSATISITDP
jgi:hypothetical protein